MRFPLQRFKAPRRVSSFFRTRFSSLVIRYSPADETFRWHHGAYPSLRRLNPRVKPSFFARVLNPAQKEWTLLRFAVCGMSVSASKPCLRLSSSFALGDAPCMQRASRCPRVLTCRNPTVAYFKRRIRWAF